MSVIEYVITYIVKILTSPKIPLRYELYLVPPLS